MQFQKVRATRWWVIITALLLTILFPIIVLPLSLGTFLNYLLGLLVIVVGVVFLLGKLRPQDVGLHLRKLPIGLLITLIIWLLIQVFALVTSLATTGHVTLNSNWSRYGVVLVLASLILSQLLGNSLFEETVWRGLFIPQLYLKFTGFAQRPRLRLILAVLIPQIFFALYHLPVLLYTGTSLDQLWLNVLLLLLIGLLLSCIYLLTDNLFIAIGVHALNDNPTFVFAVPPNLYDPFRFTFLVMVTLVALLFWYLRRKQYSNTITLSASRAAR